MKNKKVETRKIVYLIIAIIGVAAAMIALAVNMHLVDLSAKTENDENTWYSDNCGDSEFKVKVSAVDENFVKNMGGQALTLDEVSGNKTFTGNSIVYITKLENLKYNASDIIYISDSYISGNYYSGFFVPKDCVSASVDNKEFPIQTGKVTLTDGTEYEFKICMIYYSADEYPFGDITAEYPKLLLTDSKGEEHIIYDED